MKSKVVICLVIPVILQLLSGCATITRGTKDVLVVNSEPPGAKVTTSIGLSGTTPASFKVSRKEGFVVKIEKKGYHPVEVQVHTKVGGGAQGMAGNIIFGGLVGVAVDASTGATKDLIPNPINVKLVPLDSEKPSEGEEPLSYRIDFEPLDEVSMLIKISQA